MASSCNCFPLPAVWRRRRWWWWKTGLIASFTVSRMVIWNIGRQCMLSHYRAIIIIIIIKRRFIRRSSMLESLQGANNPDMLSSCEFVEPDHRMTRWYSESSLETRVSVELAANGLPWRQIFQWLRFRQHLQKCRLHWFLLANSTYRAPVHQQNLIEFQINICCSSPRFVFLISCCVPVGFYIIIIVPIICSLKLLLIFE